MTSKGDAERLVLFNRYSVNLGIHFPSLGGAFVCPICLRVFHAVDVLTGPTLKVDFGHVFPKEIGGKGTVLECRECNGRLNNAGDNELVRLYKMWDAMVPGSQAPPIGAQLQTPLGPVDVYLSSRGLHSSWERADPDAFKYAIDAMLRHKPLTLTMPVVCPRKINVASLHSAHLLFFREFGYGYLCTPGGQYIRALLTDSDSPIEDAFMSIQVPKSAGIEPSLIFRIGMCSMPDGEKCLFAALPVADPNLLCQVLFLPGPWDQEGAAFKRVMAKAETWLHEIKCRAFDRRIRDQLTAAEYKNALALAWNGWKPHNIDMTKLMLAIRKEAGERTDRRIDAELIAERFGIARAVRGYIDSLAGRGFLVRAPRRHRPHLVRLTEKSISARV